MMLLLSLLLEPVVDKSLIDQHDVLTEDVVTEWMATVENVTCLAETAKDAT